MTSIYGMKANMHGHELEDISSMGWAGLGWQNHMLQVAVLMT